MTKSNIKKKGFVLSYDSRKKESLIWQKRHNSSQGKHYWWQEWEVDCSCFHPHKRSKERTGSRVNPWALKAHPQRCAFSSKVPALKTAPPKGTKCSKPWAYYCYALLAKAPHLRLAVGFSYHHFPQPTSPHLLRDTSKVQPPSAPLSEILQLRSVLLKSW